MTRRPTSSWPAALLPGLTLLALLLGATPQSASEESRVLDMTVVDAR